MSAPLETVVAALSVGGNRVEMFVDASQFGGFHPWLDEVIQFDRTVTFRLKGPDA